VGYTDERGRPTKKQIGIIRVLIVEDEIRLAANIVAALKEAAGFAVDCGREGAALTVC